MVSMILLTLTMVGGIVNVKRLATPRWPRFVNFMLHRNVSLLAVVFLAVHIGTALLDSKVSIGWQAAVIPFSAKWSLFWVGLGTLSLDLVVALVVTSLLRSRMSRNAWRAVHWFAYACWPLAVAHGLGAGTDSSSAWAIGAFAASIAAVVGAVVWRFGHLPAGRPVSVASQRMPDLPAR
jgi:sulfoxide reductase heme-binding subunit YedZ